MQRSQGGIWHAPTSDTRYTVRGLFCTCSQWGPGSMVLDSWPAKCSHCRAVLYGQNRWIMGQASQAFRYVAAAMLADALAGRFSLASMLR